MRKKQLIPMALSSLLLAGPLAMAEEAHHPEQAGEEGAPAATAVAPATETSGEAAGGADPATTEGSGMMTPGMMQKPMMGGMQGMGGGPGSGMMKGGRGMGCKMHQGMKGGHGMMQKHQDVVNRLDLIDARLVKIEALLERLMQR